MDRRRFLLTSLAGALVAPLAAGAQQAGRIPRIGYLAWHASTDLREATELRQALSELGWLEGRNIAIEDRYAGGKPERLPALADELVRLPVDVLVASRTPAALAAKKATRTIPIVFTSIADPVRVGLVANLARPTENLTGTSTTNIELSAKRVELLKAAVPNLGRIAVVVNPTSPQSKFMLDDTQMAATRAGLEVRTVELRGADGLEGAFSVISKAAKAVVILPDPVHNPRTIQEQAARLALKYRLPMMHPYRLSAAAGALMSYGPTADDALQQTARYVDRILKGARPADLPIEQPTKYELVVNLKTAKALGLTIPSLLLLRADQVIE